MGEISSDLRYEGNFTLKQLANLIFKASENPSHFEKIKVNSDLAIAVEYDSFEDTVNLCLSIGIVYIAIPMKKSELSALVNFISNIG